MKFVNYKNDKYALLKDKKNVKGEDEITGSHR